MEFNIRNAKAFYLAVMAIPLIVLLSWAYKDLDEYKTVVQVLYFVGITMVLLWGLLIREVIKNRKFGNISFRIFYIIFPFLLLLIGLLLYHIEGVYFWKSKYTQIYIVYCTVCIVVASWILIERQKTKKDVQSKKL